MAAFLFWTFVFLVFLAYAGYPLVVAVLALLRPPRPRLPDAPLPPVTLVINTHDEAAVIRAKLENSVALDYPAERLRILVADDASTDGTLEEAASVHDERIEICSLPRGGKNAAINAIRERLDTPIVVFTDANSTYESDALRVLLAPFADAEVGAVVGEVRYVDPAGPDAVPSGEGAYWGIEQWIKRGEDRLGAVLVANGAILALRRQFVSELYPDVANDFQWPIEVLTSGAQVRYQPDAIAREPVTASLREEWPRKVRIVSRGTRGFVRMLGHLRGVLALQFLLRKGLRWLGGIFCLALVPLSLWALPAPYGPLVFAGLVAGYLASGIGLVLGPERMPTPLRLPAYVLAVQWAGLVGVWRGLRNRSPAMWTSPASTRTATPPATRE